LLGASISAKAEESIDVGAVAGLSSGFSIVGGEAVYHTSDNQSIGIEHVQGEATSATVASEMHVRQTDLFYRIYFLEHTALESALGYKQVRGRFNGDAH